MPWRPITDAQKDGSEIAAVREPFVWLVFARRFRWEGRWLIREGASWQETGLVPTHWFEEGR